VNLNGAVRTDGRRGVLVVVAADQRCGRVPAAGLLKRLAKLPVRCPAPHILKRYPGALRRDLLALAARYTLDEPPRLIREIIDVHILAPEP
jgi:hypothetical protein